MSEWDIIFKCIEELGLFKNKTNLNGFIEYFCAKYEIERTAEVEGLLRRAAGTYWELAAPKMEYYWGKDWREKVGLTTGGESNEGI